MIVWMFQLVMILARNLVPSEGVGYSSEFSSGTLHICTTASQMATAPLRFATKWSINGIFLKGFSAVKAYQCHTFYRSTLPWCCVDCSVQSTSI